MYRLEHWYNVRIVCIIIKLKVLKVLHIVLVIKQKEIKKKQRKIRGDIWSIRRMEKNMLRKELYIEQEKSVGIAKDIYIYI